MKRERNAKQAFIEGTVRVVARDGLDKTTTKAIATEAGLSEAYIYRCFESKEALLCAAFHMEDVAFAYFLKQNLVGMHTECSMEGQSVSTVVSKLEVHSWKEGRLPLLPSILLFCELPHLCIRGASPMFSGAIFSGGTDFQTGSPCQHATSSGF